MNRRIAIIGAGAAGLAAGHRLRKVGYSHVHIYEKSSRVGGKCSTIDIEGRSYEMGAVVVGMKTSLMNQDQYKKQIIIYQTLYLMMFLYVN